MKSQRRHELQHNDLAQWLAKSLGTIKPYQNIILTVVALGLVAAAAYAWVSRTSAAQTSKAWNELNGGMENESLTELTQVIDNYPDTKVARTAAVLSADYRLISGCNRLFDNKTIAQQQLRRAIVLYESDLRRGKGQLLLERATFGLARAKEAQGKLEPAARYYHEVVANWPDGAYAAAASRRLDELKRPEIKQLYDDFRHFDPQRDFFSEFDVPGQRSGFNEQNVPKEPPAEFPDLDLNLDEKVQGEEEK